MQSDEDSRAVILAALQSEEDAVRGALESIRMGLAQSLRESSGESSDDYQGAALGTAMYEREKDAGRLAALQRQLDEVLAARERLSSGKYGLCLACGERIAPARLAARPQSSMCLSCEDRQGAGAQR